MDNSLVGKRCYINMSEDSNIDKSMLGTIIDYYKDSSDEWVEISMNPYGEVIKVRDENKINLL